MRLLGLYFSSQGCAGGWVVVLLGVPVATAALLVLAELAVISSRSFVVLVYCVIVAVVSRSRMTLMLVAVEARDSKCPSNCSMMAMTGAYAACSRVCAGKERGGGTVDFAGSSSSYKRVSSSF